MFIVHNYWDCWSIAIVDTSAFKFTQRWAANTSSNVYIVFFARAFTATAQYNERRFTSSFKCSPVWQPDTTVLFLPAPFTEVWNFLTNRCFLLRVETSLKKSPFQMLKLRLGGIFSKVFTTCEEAMSGFTDLCIDLFLYMMANKSVMFLHVLRIKA